MTKTRIGSRAFSILMALCLMMTMLVTPVSAATKTSGKVGAVKWNKAKKTVSFEVTVNGDMLGGNAGVHFIINDKNGKTQTANAGAGLFTTKATALDLYNALVKAGATPWVAKGKAVASLDADAKLEDVPTGNLGNPGFSRLTMTFKKGGKTYKPEKLVNYEYKGKDTAAANPFNMCFSGNYDNQKAWNTGCVACLFSCYAGVTSNAAIGYDTVGEGADNYFYANESVLKAGDKYTVTYKITKAPYNYISAEKLNKNMSKYKVIDVREAKDVTEGHIKGAIAAPVVNKDANDPTAIANLKKVVNKYGKNKKYVLCCYTGNAYAKAGTEILKKLGVKNANILTLAGGWNNWKTKFSYQYGNKGNVIVDPVKKTVKLDAYVNGTITGVSATSGPDETHHFVVNENGSNGKKCVFPTKALPLDVYNAMVAVGATPENNSTNLCEKSHNSGEFLKGTGSKVKITVSWKNSKGKKVTKTMAQCLKRSNGEAYDDSKMEFAGCKEMYRQYDSYPGATKMNMSGCITCTFSCWIGTVSNEAYAYGSEEVMPNRKVIPKKGTPVTVTYQF